MRTRLDLPRTLLSPPRSTAIAVAVVLPFLVGCPPLPERVGRSFGPSQTTAAEVLNVVPVRRDGSLGTPVQWPHAFADSTAIFFSCGCGDCVDAGKQLAEDSGRMVCLSALDADRLCAFADKVGWRGRLYYDQASRLMVQLDSTRCPLLFTYASGTLTKAPLTKSHEDRR